MPGGGPGERMTWPGPALPPAAPPRSLSPAGGGAAPAPLTRTQSLLAMTAPLGGRPPPPSSSSSAAATAAPSRRPKVTVPPRPVPSPVLNAQERDSGRHRPRPPEGGGGSGGSGSGGGASSRSSSSNSGSGKGGDSSPTPRRALRYTLCSDNHGVRAPAPEQYLTPLQQKEVSIRHLRARLRDAHDRLQIRDSEVDELKAQLSRMQEDWVEEECQRVEAQLALKEARREIQQLRDVVDAVRAGLAAPDWPDPGPHNRKLDALLQGLAEAEPGQAWGSASAGGSAGGSPARSLTRSSTYTKLSDAGGGDPRPGEPPPGSAEAGVQVSSLRERAMQTDGGAADPGDPGDPRAVTRGPRRAGLPEGGPEGGEAAAPAPPGGYWSRHLVVDLLAVVVPALPTVAWLCRGPRPPGQPLYNVPSLLRGCCTVALGSIRRARCPPADPARPQL
ncbi:syntaphilin [Ornithorhynchus anatinus]|uniref:syntaphilin n=1 Tax=Ornithorhynchus anatinus TaxID=9258 RepID=UPI0010A872B9|nr:syntaphilin [Ornithorhynchus anatinus]